MSIKNESPGSPLCLLWHPLVGACGASLHLGEDGSLVSSSGFGWHREKFVCFSLCCLSMFVWSRTFIVQEFSVLLDCPFLDPLHKESRLSLGPLLSVFVGISGLPVSSASLWGMCGKRAQKAYHCIVP